MRSRKHKEASWLVKRYPPKRWTKKKPAGELAVWWGVLRQAARDTRYGHRSLALDGLEFLTSTGEWLSVTLFDIPQREYRKAVTELVMKRGLCRGDETITQAS